jgi:hypothetical protein
MSMAFALAFALTAAPPSSPKLAEGMALYQSLEFEKATIVLQKLVLDTSAPVADRAEAFLWLGLAYGQLGDTDGARDALHRALALDATLNAPPDSPPALLAMLEDERARVAATPPPPPPEPPPATTTIHEVARPAHPSNGSALGTAAWSSTIGAGVLASAALVVGGIGAYQLSIAYDLSVPAKPALQAYATATTCGIAAGVLGGAAILAGGAGAALFALE